MAFLHFRHLTRPAENVMTGHLAVETERLRRVYTIRGGRDAASTLVALDDVTLSVRRGEVFGVLGVNGAGKSTLLRVLTTQLRPSSGIARVAGFDVCRYRSHARRHIRHVCADNALRLAGRNAIYGIFDAIGPAVAPGASTGLRQRANVDRGLDAKPKVLFLDQPTLGLDCASAREVRTRIGRWIREDETRTVVLATNDLREASELCDRVVILDAGRVLACESPEVLRQRLDCEPTFHLETTGIGAEDATALMRVDGVRRVIRREAAGPRTIVEIVLQSDDMIAGVVAALGVLRVDFVALTKRVATLEEAFLRIVKRRVEDATGVAAT